MKKKLYISPSAEMIEVQLRHMVALSTNEDDDDRYPQGPPVNPDDIYFDEEEDPMWIKEDTTSWFNTRPQRIL